MKCDHTKFCPYCGPDQERLLKCLQIAYAILAPIEHQWAGRHTAEGQGALAAMRDAIANATEQDAEVVQNEAQGETK